MTPEFLAGLAKSNIIKLKLLFFEALVIFEVANSYYFQLRFQERSIMAGFEMFEIKLFPA